MKRGLYQLVVGVLATVEVAVGGLGRQRFEKGYYVYTGSAQGGLAARIERHLRETKTLRWHIDYLLAAPGVGVRQVWRIQGERAAECQLHQATVALRGGRPGPRGFGASDCSEGCGAHIVHFGAGLPALPPPGPWHRRVEGGNA